MKKNNSLLLPVLIVLGGIIISVMIYALQHKINNVVSQNIPQRALGENLKNKSTQAHLWLEEYLGGDESVNYEKDIKSILTKSNSILNAALKGDTCEVGSFDKPSPQFEEKLKKVQVAFIEFEKISDERNTIHSGGSLSSTVVESTPVEETPTPEAAPVQASTPTPAPAPEISADASLADLLNASISMEPSPAAAPEPEPAPVAEPVVEAVPEVVPTVPVENVAATGGEMDQKFDLAYNNLQTSLDELIKFVDVEMKADNQSVTMWIWGSILSVLITASLLAYWMYNKTKNEEKLQEDSTNKFGAEVERFSKLTTFVSSISKGEFDVTLELDTSTDELANTMVEMRNTLHHNMLEDKKRNWATEGLALFGDILRNDNDNMEVLTFKIISNLIKYLKANQGGLFVIEEVGKKQVLELTASYAYERRKFLKKHIELGEGLVGQAWQEQDKIFLTQVPEEYVEITSGLGGANPRCILIMPLKVNDEIYGMIELASFKVFEKHEIDFVERVSENIASTLSTVKVNVRTAKLLNETRLMSEQLQAQEEELRQNAEEMQATQEEMSRRILELEAMLAERG